MIPGGVAIARVRLALVQRHEDCLRAGYLHPAEERQAAALRVDKRRVDYVAGRVAVKRAVRRLWTRRAPPRAILVLPDEGPRAGAPVLFDEIGQRKEAVSISHGAGFAYAAAAMSGRLGLDVERIEPRHPGFAEEAFAAGEVARWAAALGRAEVDDRVITLAWCAKEALLKVAGVGLRAPLGSYAVEAIRWAGAPPAREAERLDAAALAWAEVWTAEMGAVTLGVATRGGAALVVAWDGDRRVC